MEDCLDIFGLYNIFSEYILFLISYKFNVGELARYLCEKLRREAASVKIQKNARKYIARTAYISLCDSAVSIQTGMRCMAARNKLKFRRQTESTIVIQVGRIFCLQ